jgi:general secretion pathway protein D
MRFAFRGVFLASLVLLPVAFGLSQPADESQGPPQPAAPSEGSEVAPAASTDSGVSEPAAPPEPQVTEPAVPVAAQPVEPAPSVAAPALAPEAPSLPSSTNEISVNLSGEVDLVTFLQGVAIATHTNFLYDDKILAGKKVRLLTPTKIPEDKLFQLLESVLEYEDIALVPSVGGIIKVIPVSQTTKKPMPLKFMEELDALPDSDRVLTAVYKLKYVTVPEVQPVIQPMLSQGAPIALLKSNILIITDSQSNLKRIAKIVTLIDDERNVAKLKITPIKHVSAEYLAGQIMRVVRAEAAGGAANKDQQQTNIDFDAPSNSLIIVATAQGMARIDELVDKLDVEPTQAASTRRRIALKNTIATKMATTLQQLAQGPPSGVRNVPGAPAGPGARYQPTAGAEGPGLITTGEVKIIADENTNSIIVFGPASALNEIEALVKDLDQRRAQVLIEALVVQVTGGNTLDVGAELGYFGGKSDHGGILNSNFGLSTFDFTTGVRTIKDGTGVTYAVVNSGQIPLLLRALLTENNGKVISRPRLLANDNEDAFFNSVDKQPTTTISQAVGVATTTSFNNYQEAGTKLKIKPTISQGATGTAGEVAAPGEGAYLTLKITLNISQFTGASTDPAVPPPQRSDDLETTVTVPDQSTIVIGGLSGYHITNTTDGIPFLSRIPVLGALFRHKVQKRDDTTEYIFIKAQVAKNIDFSDLIGLSNDAEQRSRVIEKQDLGTVTNDNGTSGGK